jgi:nucleoredoxin
MEPISIVVRVFKDGKALAVKKLNVNDTLAAARKVINLLDPYLFTLEETPVLEGDESSLSVQDILKETGEKPILHLISKPKGDNSDKPSNVVCEGGVCRIIEDLSLSDKSNNKFSELLGDSFLFDKDKIVDNSGIKKVKLIGLYFSASWCNPCKQFTPYLKKFYEDVNAEGKVFEIILVSWDKDQAPYSNYFAIMPWLALPCNDSKIGQLNQTYSVQGIPTLVILKPDLTTLFLDARERVDPTKSKKVFNTWLAEVNGEEIEKFEEPKEYDPSENPLILKLTYLQDYDMYKSSSGEYVHKPKNYNKDIYIKQEPNKNGYHWILYWYNDKNSENGHWRITTTNDSEGSNSQDFTDPESPNLGAGHDYPKYNVHYSKKFAVGGNKWLMEFHG